MRRLPKNKDGSSYLIFCYVTAEIEDDLLELSGYVDCWFSSQKDLFCEKIGDCYLAIDFFSDISDSINLVDALSLAEDGIDSLSAIDKSNASNIRNHIDGLVESLAGKSSERKDALFTLKSRTRENSNELWSLVNRSYLIDCYIFEEYVKTTA